MVVDGSQAKAQDKGQEQHHVIASGESRIELNMKKGQNPRYRLNTNKGRHTTLTVLPEDTSLPWA